MGQRVKMEEAISIEGVYPYKPFDETLANSADPDQTCIMQCLIRIFTVQTQIRHFIMLCVYYVVPNKDIHCLLTECSIKIWDF